MQAVGRRGWRKAYRLQEGGAAPCRRKGAQAVGGRGCTVQEEGGAGCRREGLHRAGGRGRRL